MFAHPQHGIPLLLKDGRTHSFVSISAPIPGLPAYALTITNGRDGIGPSPGRRKDEKTGSHQMAILTTFFRSVASRARTSRHLSARVPITTGPCTHLDYRNVQQRVQGRSLSGPTLMIECRDWDGAGAQIGPDCLACCNITSETLSRAMAAPEMSLGSSNAKGRCHCNPRCTFSFLALQDTGGGDSSSEGSPITTQLRSWLFNSQHGNQRQETGEMEPDRQSIPIVPPCAETSKHCASSCTAIVFLLVARDGHRNGRFPTQNNTRLTENLWVAFSFCDRHPDPRQQHPEGIYNHPAYAEMTGFGV